MNEFGIRLYDGGGVEYLKADSYSMRTVFSLIKPGISPSGEDVPIPSFDPDKGVILVTSYDGPFLVLSEYLIVGKFPNVILRFAASPLSESALALLILAVHYK